MELVPLLGQPSRRLHAGTRDWCLSLRLDEHEPPADALFVETREEAPRVAVARHGDVKSAPRPAGHEGPENQTRAVRLSGILELQSESRLGPVRRQIRRQLAPLPR